MSVLTVYVSAMDACAVDNGGCDHICTQTTVGRRCSCNSGYRLDTDETSCVGENCVAS